MSIVLEILQMVIGTFTREGAISLQSPERGVLAKVVIG